MAIKTENKSGAAVAKQFCQLARKSCPSAYRRKLKETLTADLMDYIDANPQADMEALTAHFGAPEDFAHEFINEMTAEEKQRMLKRAKIGRWCALAVAVVAIIAIVVSAIIIVEDSKNSDIYYYGYDVSKVEEVLITSVEEV